MDDWVSNAWDPLFIGAGWLVLVVCFLFSFYSLDSISLQLTLPYQGWTLRYPKAARGVLIHDPRTQPLPLPGARPNNLIAASGLSWVADWPPDWSSPLLRLASCAVDGLYFEQ